MKPNIDPLEEDKDIFHVWLTLALTIGLIVITWMMVNTAKGEYCPPVPPQAPPLREFEVLVESPPLPECCVDDQPGNPWRYDPMSKSWWREVKGFPQVAPVKVFVGPSPSHLLPPVPFQGYRFRPSVQECATPN